MPLPSFQDSQDRVRKIIHIDLDAFFCAVEELLDPSLKGKAFAVGGAPDQRGVVSSCSYPARRFGVHSAMPTAQALRLCPGLILVRGNYAEYQKASNGTMDVLHAITPMVEQISIDEAFLDVTDLPDEGRIIALQIQSEIKQKVNLPSSLGVATNKLVANIANNLGKSEHRGEGPPMAVRVVTPGQEATFLAPLNVSELWGIGPKTAAALKQAGIHRIGDLAACSEHWLLNRFGKSGISIHRHAKGIDRREVVSSHDTKSISNEVTFSKDLCSEEELKECLRKLSDKVGRRLRKAGFTAKTVRIKVRWPDFSTITRQLTLSEAFDQDSIIYETSHELFNLLWRKGMPVRLLGVGVSQLQSQVVQLNLWETETEKERRLLQAVDSLRDRYGSEVLKRGTRLKRASE